MPLLEEDERVLAQSGAIAKYICKRAGWSLYLNPDYITAGFFTGRRLQVTVRIILDLDLVMHSFTTKT